MFRLGQKVVCVEPIDELVKGSVYTVIRVGTGNLGQLCDVAEINTYYPFAWYTRRFRPVVERKTDISIFTKMLTPKKRRVQERA